MPRYIDADALLEQDPEICADYGSEYGCEFGYSRDQIRNAPTLSPDEVRGVGEWMPDFDIVHCSVCGAEELAREKSNYCPSCGARMKGAEDGTTD